MIETNICMLSDAEISVSVVGSGSKAPKRRTKVIVVRGNLRTVKQILKNSANSHNKIIINILIMNNNAIGPNSVAVQGANQLNHA